MNGEQTISMFSPKRGSTDSHQLSIRYVNSVPFVVNYWCAAHMVNFPSECNAMENGYIYFTIYINETQNMLLMSCNGGALPIAYNCEKLFSKDNIVWIKLKGDFGDEAVQYQPDQRRKYLYSNTVER